MSYAIVGLGTVGQAPRPRLCPEEHRSRRRQPAAEQLGFAPVNLGKLEEGGAVVHARDKRWGPLIFQDLFKKEP